MAIPPKVGKANKSSEMLLICRSIIQLEKLEHMGKHTSIYERDYLRHKLNENIGMKPGDLYSFNGENGIEFAFSGNNHIKENGVGDDISLINNNLPQLYSSKVTLSPAWSPFNLFLGLFLIAHAIVVWKKHA